MPIRTGKEYLESLRQNAPCVYLNGRRVEDVTREAIFAEPLRAVCAQYDMQSHPAYRDVLTIESPAGSRMATSFLMPSNPDERIKLRKALKLRTDATFGYMGRLPDYMNMFVTGLANAAPVFAANGPQFAKNIEQYRNYVRDNDLFMTHLLASLQNDRSKTSAEQADPTLHLCRVKETGEGIVVSGAKMLGTLAPFANETVIFPMTFAPGEDAYAVSFAIPNNAPGLKYLCRETLSPVPRTMFDHPISSRFEEMDCIAVFDDVLVPWDRVFIDGSPGSSKIAGPIAGMVTLHAEVQGTARTLSQMEFLCGLAMRVTEAIGIQGFRPIQEQLGIMLTELELARTLYWSGEPISIWAFSLHSRDLYGRFVDIIKQFAAGGFFTTPSQADFDNPELAPIIDKYLQGAGGLAAKDRVALFKLAWDVCGEGFGQRMQQYARYYSGDPPRIRGLFYSFYPAKQSLFDVVDRALGKNGDDPLPIPDPAAPRMGPPPGRGGQPPPGS